MKMQTQKKIVKRVPKQTSPKKTTPASIKPYGPLTYDETAYEQRVYLWRELLQIFGHKWLVSKIVGMIPDEIILVIYDVHFDDAALIRDCIALLANEYYYSHFLKHRLLESLLPVPYLTNADRLWNQISGPSFYKEGEIFSPFKKALDAPAPPKKPVVPKEKTPSPPKSSVSVDPPKSPDQKSFYGVRYSSRPTTLVPKKKCLLNVPSACKHCKEHSHMCPYCKLRFLCTCNKDQKFDSLCPYEGCKFFKHSKFSKPLTFHDDVITLLRKTKISERRDFLQSLLIKTLREDCDCVWNQLPAALAHELIDGKHMHRHFRTLAEERANREKIVIPPLLTPNDDGIKKQHDTVLLTAKAAKRSFNTERLQHLVNTHGKTVWYPVVNRVSEDRLVERPPSPMDTNLVRLVNKTVPEPKKETPKPAKTVSRTAAKQAIVQAIAKQRRHYETRLLEREIANVKKQMKELVSKDQLEEEVKDELASRRFTRFRNTLSNKICDFEAEFAKKLVEAASLAPLPVSPRKAEIFTIDEGKIFHKGEYVCLATDPNAFKLCFELHVLDSSKLSYEVQADIFSPITALISQMVSQTVKASKTIQAALITRLTSFCLGVTSSTVALIDSVNNESNWLKISLHVLSICSQIGDLILTILASIQILRDGSIITEVSELMSKSFTASILCMLSDNNIISKDNFKMIVENAEIGDIIIPPERKTVEQLLADKRVYEAIKCTTIMQKINDSKNTCVLDLYRTIASVPAYGKPYVLNFDAILSFKDVMELENLNDRMVALAHFVSQSAQLNINNLSELEGDKEYIASLKYIRDHLPDIDLSTDLGVYLSGILPAIASFAEVSATLHMIVDASCGENYLTTSYRNTRIEPEADVLGPILLTQQVQAFSWDLLLPFCALLGSIGISIYDYHSSGASKGSLGRAIVCGSNVNKSLKEGFKDTRSYIEECAYEFFGWTIGEKHHVRERSKEFFKKLTFYKDAENGLYCQNPEMVIECKKLTQEVRDFTVALGRNSKDLSVGEQETLRLLNLMVIQVDSKMVQVNAVLSTLGTKPTTFFVDIWGDRGSGKTTFVSQWLCPAIINKMKWKNGVYDISFNNDGNAYWPEYAQQHIGKVDDFLRNGYKDRILNRAQQLFGNNLYNMEGAYVKDQKNNNLLVLCMSSNHCCVDIPRGNELGLDKTSVASSLTRGFWFQAFNVNQWTGDKKLDIERDHVKYGDNFSHLKFFEYHVSVDDDYRRCELMEDKTQKYPVIRTQEHVKRKVSEKGEITFEVDPQGVYVAGDWYKLCHDPVPVYVREVTKEYIRDFTVERIKKNLDEYDKFLARICRTHIANLDPNKLPPVDNLYIDLSLKGIKRQVIDDVLKNYFPNYYQAGASTDHCVISFYGPTGTGKTYLVNEMVVPKLQYLFPRMEVCYPQKPEDITLMCPGIVVIDDQIRKDEGQLYMDMLAKIPSPSIVILCENMYVKRTMLPYGVLPKQQENIQDTIPVGRFALSLYYLNKKVPFNHFEFGTSSFRQPLDNCKEGWYRRLGVSGYNYTRCEIDRVKSGLQDTVNKLYCVGGFATILEAILVYLEGYWFLPLPILMFIVYLMVSCDSWFPTIAVPYVAPDYAKSYEMISYGICKNIDTSKRLHDAEVVEEIFETYKKVQVSLTNLQFIESEQQINPPIADVTVICEDLETLPTFINDKTSIFKSVTFGNQLKGRSREVLISDTVCRSAFTTCVGDFHLSSNTTKEEVLDMARRTYGTLMSGGAGFTVSIITADFEVYAKHGTIKYWTRHSARNSSWTFTEGRITLPDEVPHVICTRISDATVTDQFKLPVISVVALLEGNFKEHPDVPISLMKALIANKRTISEMAPYKVQQAILNVDSLNQKGMKQTLLEARQHHINRMQTIVGSAIGGILGLVTIAGLSTLIWSLFKTPKTKVITKSKDLGSLLLSLDKDNITVNADQTVKARLEVRLTGVYSLSVSFFFSSDGQPINKMLIAAFQSHIESKFNTSFDEFADFKFNYSFYDEVTTQAQKPKNKLKTKLDDCDALKVIGMEMDTDRAELVITVRQFTWTPSATNIENQFVDKYDTSTIRISLDDDDLEISGGPGIEVFEKAINLFCRALETQQPLRRKGQVYTLLSSIAETQDGSDKKGKNKQKARNVKKINFHARDRYEETYLTHGGLLVVPRPVIQMEAVSSIMPLNDHFTSLEECIKKFNRNVVRVTNNKTGLMLHGIGIGDRYLLTNYHAFPKYSDGTQDEATVYLDDPLNPVETLAIQATVAHSDEINDIVVVALVKDQGFRFRRIVKAFIAEEHVGRICEGAFFRTSRVGTDVMYSSCTLNTEKKHLSVEGIDGKFAPVNMRLVEHRFLNQSITTMRGDCGQAYVVNLAGRSDVSAGCWRFAGMHAFGSAISSSGPIITQEMLEYYLTTISESQVSRESRKELARATFDITQPDSEVPEVILLDKEVADEIEQYEGRTPPHIWPLFKPNRHGYGVIENSTLDFISYFDNFSHSSHGTHSHRLTMWAKELEDKFGLENTVDNTEFNPHDVEDKSKLLFSIPTETRRAVPSISYTQISYYNDKCETHPLFDQVVKDVQQEIEPYFVRWFGNKKHRELSMPEVHNGLICKNDIFYGALDGMDLNSSPGFFCGRYLKKTKRKQIMQLDHKLIEQYKTINGGRNMYSYAPTEAGQRMERRLRNKLSLAKHGRWVACVAKDSLKDETVKKENVKIGKTRVFVACDETDNLFARKVLGTYCAIQKQHHMTRHASVGIDAYSEFHYLQKRLAQTSALGEAGDFKHWDKNLNRLVLRAVLKCVKAAITSDMTPEKKKDYDNYFRILYLDMTHGLCFNDGILYQKHRGMPSGHLTTATINSDCNFFYHLVNTKINLVLYNQTVKRPLKTPEDVAFILSITDFIAYGDDKVTAIHEDYVHILNFETMQAVYQKYFGLQYTRPDKGEGTYTVKRIEELEYLSRKFHKAETNVVFPTLKKHSINGMFFWCTNHTEEVLGNTLGNLYKELTLLPEEDYNYYKPIYEYVVSRYNQRYPRKTLPALPEYRKNLADITSIILKTNFIQ